MTVFESSITIDKPIEEVYSFLADLNNHKLLMPDDIEDWTPTSNTATFNIKNMAKISLVVSGRTENLEIIIVTVDKPPFNLELKWNLAENGMQTAVMYTITADLNMMMKMLASGPLQKLANSETQNLFNVLA